MSEEAFSIFEISKKDFFKVREWGLFEKEGVHFEKSA